MGEQRSAITETKDSLTTVLDQLSSKYKEQNGKTTTSFSLWDRVSTDELLELADVLYRQGVNTTGLLTLSDDDEDYDDEEGDNDDSANDDSETDEDSGLLETEADPVMYQFSLKEEEELEEELEEDNNELEIGFESLQKGNMFKNSIRVLDIIEDRLDNLDSVERLLQLAKVHTLYGDSYLELEDFVTAIESYKKGLRLLETSEYNNSNSNSNNGGDIVALISQGIFNLYMKLVEALKWTDDTKNYAYYLERTIQLLEKKLEEEKKLSTSDSSTLEELKAELEDITSSGGHSQTTGIRTRHPGFDTVLKRALGKLLTPEELENARSVAVNDLSSMVKRRKKEK